MSEYCKSCGTHISEDDTDMCANCAKKPLDLNSHSELTVESLIKKQADEIKRLEQELAALKTPHPCVDCEHYYEDSMELHRCKDRYAMVLEIFGANEPWLCGHFQPKKGTK